ncbi:MAG: hypothetical protein HGA54_07255 [Actinobacteria bacterium]|nr:hypothetical protein [Actinomycetota bacterium]
MASQNGIAVLISMLFAGCAFALCISSLSELAVRQNRRSKMRSHFVVSENHSRGTGLLATKIEGFIRNGSPIQIPFVNSVVGHSLLGVLPTKLSSELSSAGMLCSPTRAYELSIVCAVAFALASFVISSSFVVALVVSVFSPYLLLRLASSERKKRLRRLREQLPEALSSIGVAFGAGYSLPQALSYAAANTRAPLSEELSAIVWDIEAGKGLMEALASLEKRTEIPEVSFIAVAFTIQLRTGGSLKDILESASTSLKEGFEFERNLNAQTAQARLSARIVGLMPFFLLAILFVISPEYLETFFGTARGFSVFIFAVVLDAVGLLTIKHILSVER